MSYQEPALAKRDPRRSAAWGSLRVLVLMLALGAIGLWSSSAMAGALFHTQATTTSNANLQAAAIVAKAKGAIFSISATRARRNSYRNRYPRRYKRRYNRRNNRMYRRYRRFRTPPTAPNPWARRPQGTPTPRSWIYRNRRKRSSQRHLGAGFVIHADGYAVTAARLVRRYKTLKVHFGNGKSYPVKVLGSSKMLGVALLHIQAPKGTKLPFVTLGSDKPLRIGEAVLALGVDKAEGLQASAGIVSSRGQHRRYGAILRTDASIFRSQRGGPLLNHQGLVMGIVGSGSARRGGVVHPIDAIREALPRLKAKGKLSKAMLGVAIRGVDSSLMRSLRLPTTRGALVSEVMKGTPADKGGIKPGDLIVRFHNRRISHFSALPQIVPQIKPGTTVDVVLWRNGRRMTLQVTLTSKPDITAIVHKKPALRPVAPVARPAARPASRPAARPSSQPAARPAARPAAPRVVAKSPLQRLGVSIRSLSAARAKQLNLDGTGAEVTSVTKGSVAAENGLKVGDVIAEVSRTQVKSVAHLLALLGKVPAGDSVLLLIRRNSTALFVAFTLP